MCDVFLFNYSSTVFIILVFMLHVCIYCGHLLRCMSCGIYACFDHVHYANQSVYYYLYKTVFLFFMIPSQIYFRLLHAASDRVSAVGGISALCTFPARGVAMTNQLPFCPGCASPLGCTHQCFPCRRCSQSLLGASHGAQVRYPRGCVLRHDITSFQRK